MRLILKDGSEMLLDLPDDWDGVARVYGERFAQAVGVSGVRAMLTRMANRQLADVAPDDIEARRTVARFLEKWRPSVSARDDVGRLIGTTRFERLRAMDADGRAGAARRIAAELGVTVRVMGAAERVADAGREGETP